MSDTGFGQEGVRMARPGELAGTEDIVAGALPLSADNTMSEYGAQLGTEPNTALEGSAPQVLSGLTDINPPREWNPKDHFQTYEDM